MHKFLFLRILDDIPNTYTFTKALAEGLVNQELSKMPIVLLRPSFGKIL